MPNHIYPSVDQCIYCGDTAPPLGDEHIIPYAFGGNLILPAASCKTCERTINKQIETPVLLHEWGNFRIKRKFPTRNRRRNGSQKRKTHETIYGPDGYSEVIAITDHSAPVPMYKFGEARILSGIARDLGDLQWTAVMIVDHDEEITMQRKYPKWNRAHRIKAQPYPFARLLAKIAHGYATAEWGLGAFTPLNCDIIRGLSDDYFYTVGGTWDIAPPIPGGDHATDFSVEFTSSDRALIRVDIRLFSAASTPSYHVIAGIIDLKREQHVFAFEKHRFDGKIE